jgi:hypothetical protein
MTTKTDGYAKYGGIRIPLSKKGESTHKQGSELNKILVRELASKFRELASHELVCEPCPSVSPDLQLFEHQTSKHNLRDSLATTYLYCKSTRLDRFYHSDEAHKFCPPSAKNAPKTRTLVASKTLFTAVMAVSYLSLYDIMTHSHFDT